MNWRLSLALNQTNTQSSTSDTDPLKIVERNQALSCSTPASPRARASAKRGEIPGRCDRQYNDDDQVGAPEVLRDHQRPERDDGPGECPVHHGLRPSAEVEGLRQLVHA